MNFDGDPDHPILPDPFRWDLLEFVYRRDPSDWRESHIDMTFVRDGIVRRLRFYAPQDLEMNEPGAAERLRHVHPRREWAAA